jgi:hypothetical protein
MREFEMKRMGEEESGCRKGESGKVESLVGSAKIEEIFAVDSDRWRLR